ncbi:GlxA family transcriptional regulator, partial [Escherichia coli]|nr:GlxA family transcriptional regulator [Escherichia coli]
MSARSVVVIATPGFSPFHVSVPCIIFGTILAGEALFDVKICAEQPGAIASDIGVSMNVEHGLGVLDSADIIIVPFWNHPEKSPSQNLMEALSEAWL